LFKLRERIQPIEFFRGEGRKKNNEVTGIHPETTPFRMERTAISIQAVSKSTFYIDFYES
jgi:hypothetical protein